MSIEGGAFRCDVHLDQEGKGFTTTNIDDWNAHCTTAQDPPHEEEADYTCETCGDTYHAKLPFHKLGPDGSKGIHFTCNECGDKQKTVEMTKVSVPPAETQSKGKTKK
jgi:rubredoxin